MHRCSNKALFVSLSYPFDFLTGRDKYIYPLNKEILLKSKNNGATVHVANINNQKKYIQPFEECKFIESENNNGVKLKFRPLESIRDENVSYINKDIIKMIVKDNSLFEVLENLLKNNQELYKNKFHYNYCLHHFYSSFIYNVPEFKDILFDKLDKRNFLNISILKEAVIKFNPTIEELDKYIPKKFIPNEDNYELIIDKYGEIFTNVKELYMKELNKHYNLIILSVIDPRFGKIVLEKENYNKYSYISNLFFNEMIKKNWRCFINSGFIFKNILYPEDKLKKNPCLVIFFPEEYHTEKNYINALVKDITCYPYLHKKYITSNVEKYYEDNR